MGINDLLDDAHTPPPRYRRPAEDDVPNLKGGIPGWFLAVVGGLIGVLSAGIPVVVTIARMPDGPAWQAMRDDMSSVKQKLAAQEASKAPEAEAKAAEARAVEEHNKLIDYKLDQLLNKKGSR